MDQMFDFSEDFKAAISYKELEEYMLKNFKQHMHFNVWTQCLSRKKNYHERDKKEILKVKNLVTKWKFTGWI